MNFDKKKEMVSQPPAMKVAWISDFPVEWLSDIPVELRQLPKQHPMTWQRVLLSEFEKNPALQIHVVVLRKQVKKDFAFERNGVWFHIIKVPGGLRAPSLFWLDTILICRALKKIKPDLVHAWGTERGAALVAARVPFRHLITIQGLMTWYKELVPLRPYERFAAIFEKISLRRVRIATTESSFAAAYLKAKYRNLNVHQAEHAPNWLFHCIERRPQRSPICFVAIGTLDFRKGTDLLLRALNELVGEISFELILISGPDRTFVESLKPNLSPELMRRISFKTNLLTDEVANELAVATMLLMPTRADTSPNAVKEAVVAGVPVVASAIGGIVDYVLPGKNGYLFPSNDRAAFAKAIRAALQHPLFRHGEVDMETLKNARDYLSPKTMEKSFFEAYNRALR